MLSLARYPTLRALVAAQVEAQEETVREREVVRLDGLPVAEEQRVRSVLLEQLGVAEGRPPDDESQLVERQSFLDCDREGQGNDLEVEAAVVAVGDLVEAIAAVGDDASEHVEASGRALRVGLASHAFGQRKALHQRDQIRAVRLEHRPIAQIELVDDERAHLALDGLGARQEAAPQAIRAGAQAADPGSPAGPDRRGSSRRRPRRTRGRWPGGGAATGARPARPRAGRAGSASPEDHCTALLTGLSHRPFSP